MAYELPKLAYAYDALAPHIDAKTMEIHHSKHHQAYITNANNLLKDHASLAALDVNTLIADLSQVPEAIRGGVRNNAGGHSNHAFFWTVLGPGKGGAPKGRLAAAIEAELGGFAKFKEDFAKAGATRFGSGWAWLSSTAASSPSARPPIRTARSWARPWPGSRASPSSASMSGSTPTTSITRTAAQTTSPRSGTWSIGMPPRRTTSPR
jgi:superoxide dismutase